MSRIVILDPTATPPGAEPEAIPEIHSLAGKTVGIRLDRTWKSFEWVVEEWSRLLRQEGARLRLWVAGNRIGDEGDRTRRELDSFCEEVDLAVCGLGN